MADQSFQAHQKQRVCREVRHLSSFSIQACRAMGLTKSRQFMVKCQHETAEAAKISHRRNGTYPPKGFKIPNSEAGQFKPGVSCRQRLGAKKDAERLRKSAESRRATIKRERSRILWGFEQRTKLKLYGNPKKCQYRYELRQHGYQIARGGSEAYVVAHTQRSPKVEANVRKYGIRVIE